MKKKERERSSKICDLTVLDHNSLWLNPFLINIFMTCFPPSIFFSALKGIEDTKDIYLKSVIDQIYGGSGGFGWGLCFFQFVGLYFFLHTCELLSLYCTCCILSTLYSFWLKIYFQEQIQISSVYFVLLFLVPFCKAYF